MSNRKRWWTASALTAGIWLGSRLMARARRYELRGRVVIVTGASRGLGLYLARELARAGSRLVICARDAGELAQAAHELTAAGAEVLAVPCDVGIAAETEALMTAALDRFGVIDVLINNAGIIQVGPQPTLTLADFHAVFATNFWGMVHGCLAVLPHLRARGTGRIVNITSIGGKVAIPHLLPYSASKFAALGFSEGLAAELAQEHIRVTTVVPGLMRTGSAPRVTYRGDAAQEYQWFSAGAATPLTAMSAARAARRIVHALRHGQAEVTLTWQAKLLRLAHALAPAGLVRLLSLVDRLLPAAQPGPARVGSKLPLPPPLATLLGRQARAAAPHRAK